MYRRFLIALYGFSLVAIFTATGTNYFDFGWNLLKHSLENTATIVTSIQKLYHSNCIFLITLSTLSDPDFEELSMLTELGKLLSKQKASNVIVSATTYNYSKQAFGCSRNRPLNVMLTTNRTNSTSISQIKEIKGPIWMMFTEYNIYFDKLLEQLYIPLSSEFLVAQRLPGGNFFIEEVYRIDVYSPLKWNIFGNWTMDRGLLVTEVNFFKRRENFHGTTFQAVTTDNPPFTVLLGTGTNMSIGGFVGELWKLIEDRFNFSTKFFTVQNNDLVSHKTAGKWNTMVQAVADSKVQFGIDAFAMTNTRALKVDYTIPIQLTKFKVYIRKSNKQEVYWSTFLTPFSKSIWCTTVMFLGVVALGLDITQNLRRIFLSSNANQEDAEAFAFKNSLFYVYGLVCQQGTDITPKTYPCRIAFTTACLIAVVLLANYSATLISFLTIRIEKLPFRDLKGLLKDGSYQYGMANSSAYHTIYKSSTDRFTRELYWKAMATSSHNFPTKNLDGLQRVCKKKYGYLIDVDVASTLNRGINCKIVYLPDENLDVSLGFILTRKSPYTRLIDHRLLSLKEIGVLKRIFLNVMDLTKDKDKDTTSVTIEDVAPILALLAGGIVSSIVILFLEIGFYERNIGPHKHRCSTTRDQRPPARARGRLRRVVFRRRIPNSSKVLSYCYKNQFKFHTRKTSEMFQNNFVTFYD